MALIRICDWLKKPIPQGEPVVTLQLDEHKFEISQEAAELLKSHLFDEMPGPAREVPAPQPQPPQEGPPDHLRDLVEAMGADNPSGDEPLRTRSERPDEVIPMTPAPTTPTLDPATNPIQLDMPEDLTKPLMPASEETAKRIIDEATRYPEGTLSTLGKDRRRAQKELDKLNKNSDKDKSKFEERFGK